MDSLTKRFTNEVFNPYIELLRAEYRFFHPIFDYAKEVWEEKLTEEELVNGPYLEKSQIYAPGEDLDSLPLHSKTIDTIRNRLNGRHLYRHQTDALKLLLNDKNAVIATGTSSGKTLCYQIPILDNLVRDPSPGLRAIIIYPLNALVNDQLTEWEEMLKEHSSIMFGRFTGQTPINQIQYENRLRDGIGKRFADRGLKKQQLQQEIERELKLQLKKDIPNRLNHRDAIRGNPPHILITNFSMLEYLLVRPVDAPIFENSRLKFLVLDEAHAYRGVQATEIAFLVRRLKDRLKLKNLTCIATSATLGKKGDEESTKKVRTFVEELFDSEFDNLNPIYGITAEPELKEPSFCPEPDQYIQAAEALQQNMEADISDILGARLSGKPFPELLVHDKNLYRLRKEILTKPASLADASKSLWPNKGNAESGIQALFEIVAAANINQPYEDLLPTRLHYFVKAQDGLHVCLNERCPGRVEGPPAYFVSRNNKGVPEGECPDCHQECQRSQLVEVVTCRKCGYLYGALQDLGPRRARNSEDMENPVKEDFDSFSTELGWSADSHWSYFSVENDLPYPAHFEEDEEGEQGDLIDKPFELLWCTICGKKREDGSGDICKCDKPQLRKIQIFHRQCPHSRKTSDLNNLYNQQKTLLKYCPNCLARNGSGLEPLRRFQESDDEMGLAMAIPLSHFQVSRNHFNDTRHRKLLCFTDHRQRAAAFPSLLEEETFAHDLGREIVKLIARKKRMDFMELGRSLTDVTNEDSAIFNPEFFLPVSRYPDDKPSGKDMENLWTAEIFSYFAIPDSARESAEDLGLIRVEYYLSDEEKNAFYSLSRIQELNPEESIALLQVLLGVMRRNKAFTLPDGVRHDAPAFGRVAADISYALKRDGNNVKGWLPRIKRHNAVTGYLGKVFTLRFEDACELGEEVWNFLTHNDLLISNRDKWKLNHENLYVVNAESRFVCNRCARVTSYSVRDYCPHRDCDGRLQSRPFDADQENIIARWVAGRGKPQFSTLRSEEHTAQINKDLAKEIEDDFRSHGVDLLSSTTTFEMGINIGSLQKVLLRNAPPTSASYIQRVGRAGRGEDKNSISVTLCRATKYDADAWEDPLPRLMSGEVRTPTVFVKNKFIAQRHFNAVVFAKFLRVKVMEERIISNVKQQIPFAVFLPLESRKHIPSGWLDGNSEAYLDFIEWLEDQSEGDVYSTEGRESLASAVADFTDGKNAAVKSYKEILEEITDELNLYMKERDIIHKGGHGTGELDAAIKSLLSGDIIELLARRGFLPRYAFPLDVVTLQTGMNRWSRDSDVELSRDRGIAIAEFAPGGQVIANKKVYTSAGLYVVGKRNKPVKRYYSKCPDCSQIRTESTIDALKVNCSICSRVIQRQNIRAFVVPNAFTVEYKSGREESSRHRRSTLIRQRQTLTHFIDSVKDDEYIENGGFRLTLKEDGKLFRYNLGPSNKGFRLCWSCGYSTPQQLTKSVKKHKRLRPYSGSDYCETLNPWNDITYGHEFQSFCLIVRPNERPRSVESLAYALQKGLSTFLDIEPLDIGVSWRWLAKRGKDTNVEIVLYDNVHGGAGFVKEGYENWGSVVEFAKKSCEKCACISACYDCLKSYGNQSYHEKLDRESVIDFLK